MKKNKKFIPEEIKIKLSSTFFIKNICLHCQSSPIYYYRVEEERLYKDHKKDLLKFIYVTKNCYRMCDDYYLGQSPSTCNNINMLKFSTSFKKYNPKLHYTRGLKNSNYIEYLTCACGKRAWAFNYKSSIKRKEICQRQASNFYPKKFKY